MLFQQGFSETSNPTNMNYLGLSVAENKPQKATSTKNLNLQAISGSVSNANNSNGVYVDLGKALLEASKSGDAEKVQECIKNGAPFISDWVRIHSKIMSRQNWHLIPPLNFVMKSIFSDVIYEWQKSELLVIFFYIRFHV